MLSKALELSEIPGGPPHSKQSLRLWLRLLTCTSVIEKRVRNRLRAEFHTTLPRFDVLAALEHSREGLTMGELSRQLMVSNGNVTGIVARLEKEGLLTRRAAPNDRRTHFVQLTDKGLGEFSAMAAVHETWIDEIFAEMDDEKISALMDLLDSLKTSLSVQGEQS
ncbi:MAG: MarR family transcriptional regulator [Proteobacteria bacterium]|nr:MarR family transcriptional regulator [Pseudomonadota bacterium]